MSSEPQIDLLRAHPGCCVEHRLRRSLSRMEAEVVIQQAEAAVRPGGSAGGGEKWSDSGYVFQRRIKKRFNCGV